MDARGRVFNIQRFSLHDGPGIRTTVFLQGCVLECFWCHNPEGRHAYQEVRYFPERCIACGACESACPNAAHAVEGETHTFMREKCEGTGACVAACFPQALQMNGRTMTADDVMREVFADVPFYESSGGGVTLSGGEPSLQSAFARAILSACKSAGLHTAIETCGECKWDSLEALLPFTDLVMMDIKLIPSGAHRDATGRGNERILANARQLALMEVPVIFRTPVVPGVNDTRKEITAIASFIGELVAVRKSRPGNGESEPGIRYELLNFHGLAQDKYRSLGLDYPAEGLTPPSGEAMLALLDAARSTGIDARIQK
jgi:pyruvate formate lyase activating enzyme